MSLAPAPSTAPAPCWSLALLLAALPLPARAQHADRASFPDTRLLDAGGDLGPGVRCAGPEPSAAERRANVADVAAWGARLGGASRPGGVTTVPLAWHVVRAGTAASEGNVPPSWIAAQVAVLNAAFAGTSFQFALASVDRTTNAAWYTGCYGSSEAAMKQALAVSPATTLNVYSCRPSGGVLGASTSPWSYPESDVRHGVLLLYQALPGGDAAPYNQGDVAVHETGHYLGLLHTASGDCAAGGGPADGCEATGDLVCDTPVHLPVSGCPAGSDTCPGSGPDPVRNYMSSADDACTDTFTPGQSDRMDAQVALYRPTLLEGRRGGLAHPRAAVPTAEASAAYPNPFNRSTTITYTLSAPAEATLAVYDALGRSVAVLVSGPVEAGRHAAHLDGRGLPSGVYVYRLQAGGEVQTGRLLLAR